MNSEEVKTKFDGFQQELDADYKKVEEGAEKCNDLIRTMFWDHFKLHSAVEIKKWEGREEFYFRADGSNDCSYFLRAVNKCYANKDERCERQFYLRRDLLSSEIKTTDGKTIARVGQIEEWSGCTDRMRIITKIVEPFI